MVWVFKTSVQKKNHVRRLRPLLDRTIKSEGQWNFDLEDCDRILRIETGKLDPSLIACLLRRNGFDCAEL
ncbi:hypothetical protein [Pareuzebyella sediminis]|uniref:hypothetical protein n=1 Tax=Pareuzebyella sediminis TaxID=2607998 RepID=UPI001E469BFE|nr:hypothetical protein [Pareuzebyella sediminis]